MFIKYIQCPLCGKQLLNQSYWITKENGNENEFYCDDCYRTIVVKDSNGLIIEEAD